MVLSLSVRTKTKSEQYSTTREQNVLYTEKYNPMFTPFLTSPPGWNLAIDLKLLLTANIQQRFGSYVRQSLSKIKCKRKTNKKTIKTVKSRL